MCSAGGRVKPSLVKRSATMCTRLQAVKRKGTTQGAANNGRPLIEEAPLRHPSTHPARQEPSTAALPAALPPGQPRGAAAHKAPPPGLPSPPLVPLHSLLLVLPLLLLPALLPLLLLALPPQLLALLPPLLLALPPPLPVFHPPLLLPRTRTAPAAMPAPLLNAWQRPAGQQARWRADA